LNVSSSSFIIECNVDIFRGQVSHHLSSIVSRRKWLDIINDVYGRTIANFLLFAPFS